MMRRTMIMLLAAGTAMAGAPAARAGVAALSFEDRIQAQTAIERVYYNHRIWPKENPGPKPPFEAMVPRSVIAAKVTDYLRKSAALALHWRRPITAGQLQAEINRMAKGTQDPGTLMEIFAALDHDPRRIAECLARPALADRLIRQGYAGDRRWHAAVRNAAESARGMRAAESWEDAGTGAYARVLYSIQKGGFGTHHFSDPGTGGVRTVPKEPEEFNRIKDSSAREGAGLRLVELGHAFVLSRTLRLADDQVEIESLTFSKKPFDPWWSRERERPDLDRVAAAEEPFAFRLPHTLRSDPSETGEEWSASSLDLMDQRIDHTAVWTGTEMIVWGGHTGGGCFFPTGGRYDPFTDAWAPMTPETVQKGGRVWHRAVWTGTEMIVWGGVNENGQTVRTGGRYDPLTDTWTATATEADCPSGRIDFSLIWTGSEMIVWGGNGSTGGRYNPSTDTWRRTSTGAGCPSGRWSHTAVWTGTEMIVWGGGVSDGFVSSGGRYAPSTDTWTSTSLSNYCPTGRKWHTAVWAGTEMVVWGGIDNTHYGLDSGGRYDPLTDRWTAVSRNGACPQARDSHTAVWTGTEMIVWGGYIPNGYAGTGGRYDPAMDAWSATSAGDNCPLGRIWNTAVWTGDEMIVWGGRTHWQDDLFHGGRYSPAADSWVPVSAGSHAPPARPDHEAVWTGAEMIIWGGGVESSSMNAHWNSGGRYYPATDAWLPTADGEACPSGRIYHAAVWTGREMIVWGGHSEDARFLDTGGRYDPAADAWRATATGSGCPLGRLYPTAVWTGTEMIIWGGANFTETAYCLATGGRYDPAADAWAPTATDAGCPSGRRSHAAVWTGKEMIVWGGSDSAEAWQGTGGRYDPSVDAWLPIPATADSPVARAGHAAVWTGREMIIWGGSSPEEMLTTGGRYHPDTGCWYPTSTDPNCPSGRTGPTAVWTGTQLIVWGGTTFEWLRSGGAYDPYTDSWHATGTEGACPTGRRGHTAVWTGSHMIVWGGANGMSMLSTGGIYRPLMPHNRPVEKPW